MWSCCVHRDQAKLDCWETVRAVEDPALNPSLSYSELRSLIPGFVFWFGIWALVSSFASRDYPSLSFMFILEIVRWSLSCAHPKLTQKLPVSLSPFIATRKFCGYCIQSKSETCPVLVTLHECYPCQGHGQGLGELPGNSDSLDSGRAEASDLSLSDPSLPLSPKFHPPLHNPISFICEMQETLPRHLWVSCMSSLSTDLDARWLRTTLLCSTEA